MKKILVGSALAFIVLTIAAKYLLDKKATDSKTPRANDFLRTSQDDLTEESDYFVADPIVGKIHNSNVIMRYSWPEHPNKRFEVKTNNMGFREDQDTQVAKAPGISRVIVAGDSHIDGSVNNVESFPNQLETLLNSTEEIKFEIINAGTASFFPMTYEAVLRKYSNLLPNLFIAVIYTGNDYLDTAAILEMTKPQVRPSDYYQRLEQATVIKRSLVDQALNQIFYFKNFPFMKELVTKSIIETMSRIAEICKGIGSEFIVVMLPTKLDVGKNNSESIKRAREILSISEYDIEMNRKMGDEICKKLNAHNIECWASQEAFRHATEEYFWEEDYHLNVLGHKTLAKEFLNKYSQFFKGQSDAQVK